MKKTILWVSLLIVACLTVKALTLMDGVEFDPSDNAYQYTINKTIEGVTQARVNSTCVTINNTVYCDGTGSAYMYVTYMAALGFDCYANVTKAYSVVICCYPATESGWTYNHTIYENSSNVKWGQETTDENCVLFTNLGENLDYYDVVNMHDGIQNETKSISFKTNSGAEELMGLSLVIGIGLVVAIFLYIAHKLDEEHFILKLLLILSSVTMMILIPVSTFMQANTGKIFYRIFMYIFIAFWIYVVGYFVYYILKKMNLIVGGGDEQQ